MELQLVKFLIIHLISITLCIAIQYDCDKRNMSCGCGFKNVEINEENNSPEEVIPYSWSMMVSIRYDCHQNGDPLTHCCSGTILNDRYILTAARCFDQTDNSSLLSGNITIAASIHSLSQHCQTIRVVDQLFFHPNWTSLNEAMHNIAILRLAEPLDFRTDFILSRACFPSRMNTSVEILHNNTLAVVGWNVFSSSENDMDQVLQQLIVDPIDSNDPLCARSVEDTKWLFCAGRHGAPCFSEVGGPLFEWIEDRWEIVGIESYAIDGCPRSGYKGLFVRVAAYNDWIESILNPDNIASSSTESTTTEPDITTPVKLPFAYACDRSTSCGCSYSDVVFRPTRIAGGEDVADNSWSMIVSLRFYGSEEHSCAGTLLSSSYVLTAAHCVDHFSSTHPVNITVIAGVTNRLDTDSSQRNIKEIYVHPNYTGWPHFLNNIALLRVDRPFYFLNNPVLAKTCVHHINSSVSANEQHPSNGTRLVVIGWGAMRLGSFVLSEYLKQIQIYAIDNQDQICTNSISDRELQFCAGLYDGGKDACLGDSGGPVLHWTGRYWEQVGIIGYNFNCGRPGHPGIYIRLPHYWQWMEDILNVTNEHLEPQFSSLSTTTSTSTSSPRTTTRRPVTTNSTRLLSSPTTTTFNIPHTTMTTSIPHTATITVNSQTTTTTGSTLSPMTTTASNGSQTATTTVNPRTTATSSSPLSPIITSASNGPQTATTTGSPQTTATNSGPLPPITTTASNGPQTATTEPDITTPVKLPFAYACDRSTSCGCSYSDVVFRPTRIAGGEDVADNSWSMIVSLRFYGSEEHSCAGTLLSSSYVLTAAHCVDHFSSTHPVNITVIAGVTNRLDTDSSQRNIKEIYVHPNYTGWPHFLNNIALLRVDRPFYFLNNPVLAKTCVHRINSSVSVNEQHPSNGTRLVVIGWGAMRLGSFVLSEYLKQIQIYAIDNQDQICTNSISDRELQFCAGLYDGGKDACLGDSGGPVLHWTGRYWEQVGIIGYNFNCGRPGHPGIYIRLPHYWQWMEDILNVTNEHLEPQFSSLSTTTSTSTSSPRTTTRRPVTTNSTRLLSSPTTTTFNIPHTTMTTSIPHTATITVNSQTTATSSSSLPPMTTTASNGPQATTAINGSQTASTTGSPQTMTITVNPQTMTSTNSSLSPMTRTASNVPPTATITGSPQTMMTTSSPLSPMITTASNRPQTTAAVSIPLSPMTTTASNVPPTATTTGSPQTMMTTSSPLSPMTTVTSNRPQTTATNSSPLSPMTTTASNGPQTATTTGSPQTMTITVNPQTMTITVNPQTMTSTSSSLSQMTTTSNGASTATITRSPQTMMTTSSPLSSMTTTASNGPQTTATNSSPLSP